MNKKIFAAVLAVTLTFGTVCLPAAENGVNMSANAILELEQIILDGDFYYNKNLDDTVNISKYIGEDTDVKIPETIAGMKVTSIGYQAFFRRTDIKSVEIPKSVNKIGMDAFLGCESLETVNIPNGVTAIEDYTFYGCENLKSMQLPKTVRSIGESAFKKSGKMEKINLHDNIEYIGKCAIQECCALKSIVIPKKIKVIHEYAFQFCTSVTSLTLPEGLEEVEDHAFDNCTRIESVKFPSTLKKIGFGAFESIFEMKELDLGNLEYMGDHAFFQCTDITKVKIPGTLKDIPAHAFYACCSLKDVEIPEGVRSIGYFAFANCIALKKATIPESVIYMGSYVFNCDTNLKNYDGFKLTCYIGTKGEEYAKRRGLDYNLKLGKVKNLKAKSTSNSSKLSWSKVSGATGYEVYRYDTAKKKSIKVGTTAQNSYTVKSLKSGTNYIFIVKAYRNLVSSKMYSVNSTVSTVTVPAKVTGLSAVTTNKNAKLTWKKTSGATGYVIYRYDSTKKAFVKVASTAKNTYTVSKLKSGTAYKFVVKAYKKSGSKYVFGTKSATVTAVTNPAKPTLKATAGKKKVALKWNKVTGATGYKVYYKTSPKDAYKLLKTTKSVSLTKTGLTSGKTYYFAVKAYKTVGKITKFSDISAVKTLKVK